MTEPGQTEEVTNPLFQHYHYPRHVMWNPGLFQFKDDLDLAEHEDGYDERCSICSIDVERMEQEFPSLRENWGATTSTTVWPFMIMKFDKGTGVDR